MFVLQAQTQSKMLALLTDDQKAKVDPSMYAHIGDFLANVRQLPVPPATTRPAAPVAVR